MPLIQPFVGLRPAVGKESAVCAPPYDVLNTEEARERAKGKPWSFLHVSRSEIDLHKGIDAYDEKVYLKAKENFQAMLDKGILVSDDKACYYIYRLKMGAHQQTGVVAVASVEHYDTNRIRKHEFTRPDKEDDRVKQIDALNAQTGPVFLTYRHSPAIDTFINNAVRSPAIVDIIADDNVQHWLWKIDKKESLDFITEEFDKLGCMYIADGHHRSAAASRICAMHRQSNTDHTGKENYNYFLSVIFPDDQIKILDYNRVVRDLNSLSIQSFLRKVEKVFRVEQQTALFKPTKRGEFGMYLDGVWYKLEIKFELSAVTDPVDKLDVSILGKTLIAPILGIDDPRRDKRIDFVGGIRGLTELEKRVDSGEMKVAFALYPTSIVDLMAVADANKVMPPKSTWFEPKLADGLVSHLL